MVDFKSKAQIRKVPITPEGATEPILVWRLGVALGLVPKEERVAEEPSWSSMDIIVWVGTFSTFEDARQFLLRHVHEVIRTYDYPRSRLQVLKAIYDGRNIDNNGW